MNPTQPGSEISKAYRDALAARRQWSGLAGRTRNDGLREAAHGDLHEAVMSWFEVLIPYLSTADGEVAQYWTDAPLWPIEPARGDDGTLRRSEDGRDLYEWATGLNRLTAWVDETEVVTEQVGTFKKRTVQREQPVRLSPDVLIRVARYLDAAAAKLDLLAEMTDASPKAKI